MDTVGYYDQHAQEFYDQTIGVRMDDLYRPFLERILPGGHILDAGCGSGRDSLYFKQQGYLVTAMDPSAEMVKLSGQLTGQETLQLTFQEMTFEKEFDGIWACASLLHVPKAEIDDVLARLEKALKPGGTLYASFKLGDWEGERNGRFFNCYTDVALQAVLQRHPGLRLVATMLSEDVRPSHKGDYWLNTIIEARSVQG